MWAAANGIGREPPAYLVIFFEDWMQDTGMEHGTGGGRRMDVDADAEVVD